MKNKLVLSLWGQHRICHLKAFFFSQAGCFGGGLKTCSVSEVLLPLKRLLTNDPKQKLLRIPELFLLSWTDSEVGLIPHVLFLQAVPMMQTVCARGEQRTRGQCLSC